MKKDILRHRRRTILYAGLLLMVLAVLQLPAFGYAAEKPPVSRESTDLLTRTGKAMAEVTAAVKPAIVNISTTRTIKMQGGNDPFFDDPFFRRFFGNRFGNQGQPREKKSAGLGSGVIVSRDGYIITNYHVIKEADEIKVLAAGKEHKAVVVGSDPKTEISIIKIDGHHLPTVEWGDSDRLEVGEIVLAVGNPYGLNQTVTMGIVSALGRANVGIADYEDFIQTDAAINPGNSGGALVNARGELVGINTAIFSTSGGYQGIGFAIPSKMVKSIMDSLINKGKVVRGWLGVSIQKVTPELQKQFNLEDDQGALVSDVVEDSPADKAGLKRGDVITEFDNRRIDEPYMLRNMVANSSPGEDHDMTVLRENRTLKLRIRTGELPPDQAQAAEGDYTNALRGVSVQEITPELSKKLGIPARIKGVIISDIDEASPAAGVLSQGDIIQEVNKKKIPDLKTYQDVVSKIRKDEDVLLVVHRGGSSRYVTLSTK